MSDKLATGEDLDAMIRMAQRVLDGATVRVPVELQLRTLARTVIHLYENQKAQP